MWFGKIVRFWMRGLAVISAVFMSGICWAAFSSGERLLNSGRREEYGLLVEGGERGGRNGGQFHIARSDKIDMAISAAIFPSAPLLSAILLPGSLSPVVLSAGPMLTAKKYVFSVDSTKPMNQPFTL